MTANEITAQLLIEIPKRMPFIRIWRNNRLTATVTGAGGTARRVSAGVDGQADICGIVGYNPYGSSGRMLQIEVKSATDRMRPSQISFARVIEAHGGIFIIARDVERCLKELDWRLRETVKREGQE